MKPKANNPNRQLQFLMPDLASMLDARQPLYRLAQAIDWGEFERAFASLYHEEGRPAVAISDRGYRGRRHFGTTELVLPERGKPTSSTYQKRQARQRFRRRAAIEPRIGHLKSDFRLARNFLRGVAGDGINLMLAASAANLRLWLRMVLASLQPLRVRLALLLRSISIAATVSRAASVRAEAQPTRDLCFATGS